MSKTTKWIIGIVIAIIVLQFVLPFAWQLIFPNSFAGYGGPMMRGYGYGYGMHRQMMGYGYGTPFGMIFIWLIPMGVLALIVLGIMFLVRKLTEKPA